MFYSVCRSRHGFSKISQLYKHPLLFPFKRLLHSGKYYVRNAYGIGKAALTRQYDFILGCIDLADEYSLAKRDSESLALTYRVSNYALMSAQNRAVIKHKISIRKRALDIFNIGSIVTARYEAYLLTLLLISRLKSGNARLFLDLGLYLVGKREQEHL